MRFADFLVKRGRNRQAEDVTMGLIVTMTDNSKLEYCSLSNKYFYSLLCVCISNVTVTELKRIARFVVKPNYPLSLSFMPLSHSLILAAPVCVSVCVCVGKAKV